MKTDDLREAYLRFFESKGCERRPSDVLVPKGDPTVLFTPAGMNQFKREFLGLGPPHFKRATTCQKCLRTGDIENVGRTAYHHTFFEMLGNFSFGDYFKQEAIRWAWEFCTSSNWLGLPPDKLTVTVYLDDDEAAEIWRRDVGLAASKISRKGEEDNFWPAGAPSHGPDGVCGPCSEIFYDTPTGPVEIWNLVFTQFNRVGPPPNNLTPLPSKNIDTGMGLERTAAALQGVHSNFDIDIFRPIIREMAEILGRPYDREHPDSVRLRRIADHIRAVTFCIHENVLPSNEKQGYVVRRLLRRAVLDGYRLGLRDPFFHRLTSVVRDVFQRPYPELADTADRVTQVIRTEEERFLATLDTGIQYLDRIMSRLSKTGESMISGEEAFKLHATYGFPIELTESLASEARLQVDRSAFDREWKSHIELSGSGAFSGNVFAVGPIDSLRKTMAGTKFLGYETTELEATIRAIIVQNELEDECLVGHGDVIALVLDRSPFYGESGGQVGDVGAIHSLSNTAVGQGVPEPDFTFDVVDTKREGDFILHLGHVRSGQIRVGDPVRATVDAVRRAAIRRAHTATHVLHYALRKFLGPHATQAGSKVDADYLRFDFTHPEAVRSEELEQIEDEMNARVIDAAPVQWQTMPLAEAKQIGAMALFGEKYGDTVRVVKTGDFSRELCGGTHLDNTGQIGLIKITSEESVAAGTRRIVALTGPAALRHVREHETRLRELAQLLKVPSSDVVRRAQGLFEEIRSLKKQVSERRAMPGGSGAPELDELIASATSIGEVKVIARDLGDAPIDELRTQIDRLRRKAGSIAVLLASKSDGKVQLVAGLSRDLVDRGLHAGAWIKVAATVLGGSGGGKPDMAQAGGKDPSQIPAALARAIEEIKQQLEGKKSS